MIALAADGPMATDGPRAPEADAGAVWRMRRGATVLPDGGVRFEVWAPRVGRMAVQLYDSDGTPRADVELERDDGDVFSGVVAGARPGDDYRFLLDGEREVADPVSRWQPDDVFGPSRIVDPYAFRWSDEGWRGLEMADLVMYELHVGTFSHEGTFDGVARHLGELRELGVTAIELMPVAEFPGARNWGYDGVHLYAPESSYGGPDGLRRLVDAAHREGLAVLLDVVYNHTGPEGSVLHEYGPYFVDRYRTPWGGGPNTDGPDSDEVRRFIVDNALHWVTEYHLDGLRLDATEFIHDFSARHILEELATAVHEQSEALGRRILVTAETALNDPRWVRPPELGGFGHDSTWLDDFHHAVRTAVTPEREGYYADFAGVSSLVRSYANRYVYDGLYSTHARRRRGAPARDVPTDRFVAFIQNHDQVGNRARGERLADLASPAQCRLAAAALLLSPFVPLLFMGEEYGERNPFLYFVDHRSPDLLDAVRDGRREEFAGFAWEGEVPDPAEEETFERSRLDRRRATEPGHREMLALYRELLAIRRSEPLLRPGTVQPVVEHDGESEWISLHYPSATEAGVPGAGAPLWVALNFAGAPRRVSAPRGAGSGVEGGIWRAVLSTDEARFGGGGAVPEPVMATGSDAAADLAPHSAILFRLEQDRLEQD
ncbi:MAG TPA: malto-oligosyltrehalose trehalohydrolase [Gemmatimonadales bacterium]